MTIYGQVVIGAPGVGKTTYCNGMQQYLRLLGRSCYVVNLDPANEFIAAQQQSEESGLSSNTEYNEEEKCLPYEMIFDICSEVIHLSSVMEELKLGPNGGLLYCMEYLQHHSKDIIKTLQSRIEQYTKSTNMEKDNNNNQPEKEQPVYLLFDLPGQVELYTHSTCIQNFFNSITKTLDARLCLVQLLDSHFCLGNSERYISGVLSCMASMVRLELPTVNVLSKVDLLRGRNEDDLALGMEFFLDCHDMTRLLPFVNDTSGSTGLNHDYDDYADDAEYQQAIKYKTSSQFYKRYNKLHQALCEVIDDFSLVSFIPLDINDVESVSRVAARVDKANGYVFISDHRINEMDSMFNGAIENETDWKFELLADVQERLGDVHAEEIKELQS